MLLQNPTEHIETSRSIWIYLYSGVQFCGCGSKPPLTLTTVDVQEGASKPTASAREFPASHVLDEPINCVAPGLERGQWLSCGEDGLVALADWRQGSVLQTWRGHKKGFASEGRVEALDAALASMRQRTGGGAAAPCRTEVHRLSTAEHRRRR